MARVEFEYIPIRMNYPKDYSTPFVDNEESEVTFRIYAGDSNTKDVQYNSYGNVSIIGALPELTLGVKYHITAEKEMKNNNPQYKVKWYRREKPMEKNEIRMFLNEFLTAKHVNEVMKSYPNIIDIINDGKIDEIDLSKLHGIGESYIKVIERKVLENFKFAEIIAEFKGMLDFEILKKLSNKCTSIDAIKSEIKNNPYEILTDISRIGFKTADKIILNFDKKCKKALKKGEVPPINFDYDLLTSRQRASACVNFTLTENENNGHSKMKINDLVKTVKGLTPQAYDNLVNVLKDKDKFVIKKPYIANRNTYESEKYIADKIIEGLKYSNKWDIKDGDYYEFDGIKLTDEQSKTIPLLCDNNIVILRGSAGMGKSQSIKSVINMLDDNKKSFLISSPTGRAAKVIAGFTNKPSSTIHRGLGFNPAKGWMYNEKNKLNVDIVILDESSMIDIMLMEKLISAIDFKKTKILFVGDENQAPSVGCGNIYYDLINSNTIPTNTLSVVFRYGAGGILTAATDTSKSKVFLNKKEQLQKFGDDNGYIFFNIQQEKIIKNVFNLYSKLIKTNKAEDIMILSGYNVGEYGTVKINRIIQTIANPNAKDNKTHIKFGDDKYYENDLVIQTVNNYKAMKYQGNEKDKVFISNGDIGTIVKITDRNQVIVKFDKDVVLYDKSDFINIKLAYSISILKSQGGQAKNVILITPRAHTFYLNSNLIYVGMTRAKERVYHFGEADTVNRCIKKKADFNRKTFLKDILKG